MKLRRSVFRVPPGWPAADPRWTPPGGWEPPPDMAPPPSDWVWVRTSYTLTAKLLAGALVIVFAAAAIVVWITIRVHEYDSRRDDVLKKYQHMYRSCMGQESNPSQCMDKAYSACTVDRFWMADPPFSAITQDDPISDASTLCQSVNA